MLEAKFIAKRKEYRNSAIISFVCLAIYLPLISYKVGEEGVERYKEANVECYRFVVGNLALFTIYTILGILFYFTFKKGERNKICGLLDFFGFLFNVYWMIMGTQWCWNDKRESIKFMESRVRYM